MLDNILSFFSRHKSGTAAKDRLQVLLKIDRRNTSNINEEIMEKLREELMQVVNKYLDIDTEQLDMKVERSTDEYGRVVSSLVANIPINKAKNK